MRYIRLDIYIDGAWLDDVRYAGGDKHEYLLGESTSTVEELNDIVTELGYKFNRITFSYFKDVQLTHRVDISDDNGVEDFVHVAKRRGSGNACLFVVGDIDDDGGSSDEEDDDSEGIDDVGARMGIGGSDEEEEGEVSFRVGQTFDSKDCFKEAVFKYAVMQKMDIKFQRSEKTKVHARCRSKDCSWSLYGSKNSASPLWTVRSYADSHTCSRDGQVKLFSAKKIAAHFRDEFRCNTHLYAVDMKKRLAVERILVSKDKCQAARKILKDELKV